MSDILTFLIVLTFFLGVWRIIEKTNLFFKRLHWPIIQFPIVSRKAYNSLLADYNYYVGHDHIGKRDPIIGHLFTCKVCYLNFFEDKSKAVRVEHTETYEDNITITSNGKQYTLPLVDDAPKPKKDKSQNNKQSKQPKKDKQGQQSNSNGNGSLVFVGKLQEEVFAGGKVGIVEHLQQPLSVGDSLKTKNGSPLPIVNLQIDRVDVEQASKGDSVGIEFRDSVGGGWNLFEV